MSTEIFSFVPKIGYAEGFIFRTRITELEGGFEQRAKVFSSSKFVAEGMAIRFPPNNPETFKNFFIGREGKYDTFLFKALEDINNKITLEALGTGDGIISSFALDMKFIDSSSLNVFVDSVASTSGWTLNNNYTLPRVTFNPVPGNNKVITATYEYYIPVRFDDDKNVLGIMCHTGQVSTGTFITEISKLIQDNPGTHKV